MKAPAAALRPSAVFGRRVREARTGRGWKQQDLADRLTEIGRKTDRAFLSRVERGKTTAEVDLVLALAAALDVAPVHLLAPLDDEAIIEVTPKLRFPAADVRAWIRGQRALPGADALTFFLAEVSESEVREKLRARLTPAGGPHSLAALMTDPEKLEATVEATIESLRDLVADTRAEHKPRRKRSTEGDSDG